MKNDAQKDRSQKVKMAAEKTCLILASASPRRREMFEALGLPFRVVVPRVSEVPRHEETPVDFALRNSREKAHCVARGGCADLSERGGCVIVAADTIVVLENRILGKPESEEHARAMLHALSGKTHEVITGLCVLSVRGSNVAREKTQAVRTQVVFKELDADEIDAYIRTHEPMDKAGAYAIQGIGGFMVREIAGSYTNVVGLPLCELVELLEKDFAFPLFG